MFVAVRGDLVRAFEGTPLCVLHNLAVSLENDVRLVWNIIEHVVFGVGDAAGHGIDIGGIEAVSAVEKPSCGGFEMEDAGCEEVGVDVEADFGSESVQEWA